MTKSKSMAIPRATGRTVLRKFDAADYLVSEPAITAYLEAALEEDDAGFFQHALGTVARARGMHEIAEKSDATRAGLYKALSADGNPGFATVQRVVNALGYQLTITRAATKRRSPAVHVAKPSPRKATKSAARSRK